jgi:hypothetical protein
LSVNSILQDNGHAPSSSQLDKNFERIFWLESMLQEYTGHSLRHDLELIDGKLLTKDGEDILPIVANINDKFVAAYLIGELSWIINAGLDGLPDLSLIIEFENGRLYDVGQQHGFGPGQTDWISKLPGTIYDENLLTETYH